MSERLASERDENNPIILTTDKGELTARGHLLERGFFGGLTTNGHYTYDDGAGLSFEKQPPAPNESVIKVGAAALSPERYLMEDGFYTAATSEGTYTHTDGGFVYEPKDTLQ